MLRALVISGIVILTAYLGYQIQQEYEPVVIEPESYVAPEIVEEEPTVVYIQYTSEPEPEVQYAPEPEPVAPVDPAPTGRLQPEFINEQITCESFSSQWTAQQFYSANPKSYVTLDPEQDGIACARRSEIPVIRQDGPTNPPPARGCYPSCEYERLQELTPDEREAIGAARYMPPFPPPAHSKSR
jgi:hypothetical protein